MSRTNSFHTLLKKLVSRHNVLLMLLTLLVLPAASTQAQVVNYLPCGELTAADCDLLTSAVDQTLSAASATLLFDTQAMLSSSAEVIFSVSGEATYALNGFGGFIDQLSFDRAAFVPQNRLQMAEVANGFLADLRRLNAGFILAVTLSPSLGLDLPGSLLMDAQLVDGSGYINLDSIGILFNNPLLGEGIGGLDLVSLARALLELEPRLIEEMALLDYFYLNTNILVQNPADAAFLLPYVQVERLADEGSNAVFEMALDVPGLLADDDFRAWLARRAEMHRQFFTEERIGQALFLLSILTQDTELVMQGRVDLDSGHLLLLNGALQMQTAAATVQPPISLEFTVQWRDLNTTAPVTPPATARILPYQILVEQAN